MQHILTSEEVCVTDIGASRASVSFELSPA